MVLETLLGDSKTKRGNNKQWTRTNINSTFSVYL